MGNSPQAGVRNSYHGAVLNGRMLHQDAFQFCGGEFVLPPLNHLFFPIEDINIPFLIHPGDIARVEPPIPKRQFRVLRMVPVSLKNIRSANRQFSGFPTGHFLDPFFPVHDPVLAIADRNSDGTFFDSCGRIGMGCGGSLA